MTTPRKGPVVIEIAAEADANPADAPPVAPDPALPEGQAMQTLAALGARRPNRLARLFWAALLALAGFLAGLWAWDLVVSLLSTRPVLGWVATGLLSLVGATLILLALREWAALSRLKRIDGLRRAAERALRQGTPEDARRVLDQLDTLYRPRPDMALPRRELDRLKSESVEAETMLLAAEATLLPPLDTAAAREVEAAARQVATVTALVPLALADVIAALTANLRMIRRIAEIYGGRAGTLGGWRLTRAVLTHLVATGAVAIGDDMLGSALGGSVLSRLSRRLGEGVVNGALTARVGVAAMEVCRPLPFAPDHRPRVTRLVKQALTGFIGAARDA